ncbi:MAG: ABC-type sugar transport system, periplasmic component [Acetothermia bacterium 64_32]|nr:MAG: ABC-type sugar transport system, periplasmic component [Acetothermia bacterium 64_32]HAF70334.1 sugar ABC transporter substrate-binding protein [Candidatus Acetothermia bacterium]
MKKIVCLVLAVAALGSLGLAKTKIVIAGRDGGYGQVLELAARLYMADHPDVEIELLKLPYASLYEKLVIDLAEGIGAYDVVMLDDTWATEFMSQGWLADLEGLGYTPDPDFVDNALAVGRYPYPDGALYALPHVGNVELFAYRRDLFEKYGLPHPPRSWLEVLGAAALIEEYEPEVSGVVFRGRKGNPIVTGFLPIFWAFGGRIVEDGQAKVASPAGVAALKFFLALKDYAPEGVEVYDSSEVKDALLAGDVAIAIEVWPGWVPALDDPAQSKVVGLVDIIPAPGLVEESSPMIGIWLLGVSSASQNKQAALDFIEFTTSAEIQRKLTLELGHPPTRHSVYSDPEVVANYRWFPAQLAAMDSAVPRPRVPVWSEIEGVLGDYLQLALVGEMSPEDALRAAQARIQEILER